MYPVDAKNFQGKSCASFLKKIINGIISLIRRQHAMDEIKNMLVQLLEGQEEIKIEVRKSSIAIEDIKKDLKQLAEMQENHYEENLRNHKQVCTNAI
jgi:hypothetical protein